MRGQLKKCSHLPSLHRYNQVGLHLVLCQVSASLMTMTFLDLILAFQTVQGLSGDVHSAATPPSSSIVIQHHNHALLSNTIIQHCYLKPSSNIVIQHHHSKSLSNIIIQHYYLTPLSSIAIQHYYLPLSSNILIQHNRITEPHNTIISNHCSTGDKNHHCRQ